MTFQIQRPSFVVIICSPQQYFTFHIRSLLRLFYGYFVGKAEPKILRLV